MLHSSCRMREGTSFSNRLESSRELTGLWNEDNHPSMCAKRVRVVRNCSRAQFRENTGPTSWSLPPEVATILKKKKWQMFSVTATFGSVVLSVSQEVSAVAMRLNECSGSDLDLAFISLQVYECMSSSGVMLLFYIMESVIETTQGITGWVMRRCTMRRSLFLN